jgi:phospholipase C
MLGPTDPNRLYMWTGWVDPNGTTKGGPATDNSMAYNNPYLTWTTYPERLTQAGVTWQVYQEEDNYDDNALEWFTQFAEAPRSSELYKRGMTRKSAGWFEYDAMNDNLPQVSWLVAPSSQTEHPNWTPAGGAEYIASKLNAIAANPDVWNKTLFILTYDENDGYFDHVAPPVPPAGTPDEFVDGVPIGAGFRVPAIVVSPWTAGGYVDSTLMDHTSLIRILERRWGVTEPHISAYRRKIMGDFTTSLQFQRSPSDFPAHNKQLQNKTVEKDFVTMQQQVANNPAPTVPTGAQIMPKQKKN